MDITNLTITQLAQLLYSKQISPLELVQAQLSRIEALNPKLNCYITLCPENAIAQAKMCVQAGKMPAALCGTTLAIKDLFETKGIRTTMGSRFYAEYIPKQNAHIVGKLFDAGMICIGKTNMHEIALGITNINPHYGVCRNPWNIECITGGSSGGSAAALAADLCMGALGSDTGGSIRIPSALCGVVGLKPTYGRLSLRGVLPLSWTSDHAGLMARCVEDVALMLEATAGYDAHDPASQNMPVDHYSKKIKYGVKQWRIALVNDSYFSDADDEVWNAVKEAAAVFEQLGAEIKEAPFPGGQEAASANGLIITSEAAVIHDEHMKTHPEWFGEDVLRRLQKGESYSTQEYILARHTQSQIRHQFEHFFDDFDVLLIPTTPITAPPILNLDSVSLAPILTRFTAPFNLTGLPAISLPCGFTPSGMPIGLQIITRPWGEATLLRAAFAYQQATPWHLKQPVIPDDRH